MNQEVKDFQRATADRILHIYKNLGHRRVLLADEVGLGKTFVPNKSSIWSVNGTNRRKMTSLRWFIFVQMPT